MSVEHAPWCATRKDGLIQDFSVKVECSCGAEAEAEHSPKFWDCLEGNEVYGHTCIGDAIEDYLNDCEPLPETVTVYGFRPVELPKAVSFRGDLGGLDVLLEFMFERLDEEHGNPEEETEATDKMKEAELAFIQVVLAEYSTWCCEKVCEVEIDVKAWVKDNCPEWLEKD